MEDMVEEMVAEGVAEEMVAEGVSKRRSKNHP